MHTRRSPRLSGFDYGTAGAYFVTVCTHGRRLVFGSVVDGAVRPKALGALVAEGLEAIPGHHPHVAVDAYVVMPDHVHAILFLGLSDPAAPGAPGAATTPPLQVVVQGFKAGVSRRAGRAVWQRGFYDHIVRDEHELEALRSYVETNPQRWEHRRRA